MKKISLSVLASVVTLELFSGSALAQDTPGVRADNGTTIEDVIVTARRREESLQEVPLAVVALGPTQLKELRVTEIFDVTFSVPNMQIWPGLSTPSQPQIVLRGQQQSLFTDFNVVTYVNDVPQSTRGLTFFDMESIQALKGPQGTLFGKNSMGGAMVFQTKQPVYEFEGFVQGEYGNYDRRRFTGAVNVPLIEDKIALRVSGEVLRRDGAFDNVYPGGDDLSDRHMDAVRALLLVEPTDRLKNTFQADFLSKDEIQSPLLVDGAPLASLSPLAALVADAVTQQSVLGGGVPSVNVSGGVLERQGDPFITSTPTGNATFPIGGAFGPYNIPVGQGFDLDVFGFQNVTTYEFSDNLTFKNILGYRDEKSLEHANASGVEGFMVDVSPLFAPGFGPIPGAVTLSATHTRETLESFTEEAQLIGDFESVDFIIGAFFSDETDTYASINQLGVAGFDATGAGLGPSYRDINQDKKSYAVFAQGTYDFSSQGLEGLSITAGLRQTWDKREFEFQEFLTVGNTSLPQKFATSHPAAACTLFGGSGATATAIVTADTCLGVAKRNTDELTWNASIEYKVTDDTMLYIGTRKGYKAGQGQPTPALDFALHDPETIKDIEVGMKHEGNVGSVGYRLNIAAFRGKYKDIQVPTVLTFCSFPPACGPTDPFFGSYLIFNAAHATIKGVEIDGVIVLTDNLMFSFGYSFQDTEYGKGSAVPAPAFPGPISPANPLGFGAAGNVIEGKSFGNVPERQFNVAGSYTLDFVPKQFARPVLTAHYAWRGKEPAQPSLGPGAVGLPKFGVLNARLSFEELFGSSASLSFWGQNLTDKKYEIIRVDNTNSLSYVSTGFGDPRTYGVTLSYEW